jgi:anti-anti-sigma regulatory factor
MRPRTDHRVVTEYRVDGSLLAVDGPLAEAEVPALHARCLELFATDAPVVTLDLRDVTEIASRCIGVLTTFWIDLAVAARRFDILPSRIVKRALDLSGFSQVFLPPPGRASGLAGR